MPGNDVKRTVLSLIGEEFALEFVNDCPLFLCVFVPSNRSLEVSWVGKAIGSDGAQIRNHEMTLIDFAQISS